MGGGGWTPGYQIDQSRWLTAHLPLSRYAAQNLPGLGRPFHVLGGGVDLCRFPPRTSRVHDGSVVFLGRILRHKGIHWLIEAIPSRIPLRILGASGDADYLAQLRRLAVGKDVHFILDLADEAVAETLRRAAVVAHPTPVDESGDAGVSELLGLAPLEAMACGCVPVLSRAASLPELVEEGVSGLLVPPNDPAALGDAIRSLLTDAENWRRMSVAATARVREQFTWSGVAQRCLTAYDAT
jgi:starch synthase